MKNIKYNIEEIFKLLNNSEIKLKKEIINSGKEVWPLLKISIWNYLNRSLELQSQEKFENSSKKILRSILKSFNLKKIIYLIASKKYRKFRLNYKELKNSEVLFFSRNVYLEKLNSDLYFDRIVDPIYATSRANFKSSKIYIDNYFGKNLFYHGYFHKIIRRFNRNIKTKEYKDIELKALFLIRKFIQLNNLETFENELNENIKIMIKNYLKSKNNAKNIFKKTINVKKIFVTSWYFADMMGIIAAANEKGITSVEIQHGKQGKFQAAYSGWNFIPNEGYLNVPNFFWCWGEKSVQNILQSDKNRKNHIPIIGNYSWPIWYKTFIKNNKKSSSNRYKIRLLFVMQWKSSQTLTEPFPDALIDLVEFHNKKNAQIENNNFHLTIRLHPNVIDESEKYLKERLVNFNHSKLITIKSKKDCSLYEDFQNATHHLTCFSTSSIEALLFNIKSAVYGDHAREIYKDEIETNTIKYFKKLTLKDINNWLTEKQNFKIDTTSKYIINAFPDPNLIN